MKWLVRHWLGLERDALTDVQYHQLSQRIWERSRAERWSNVWTLIPAAAPLAFTPMLITPSMGVPLPWLFTVEIALVVGMGALVYWVLRRRYTRHGWRALRELGYADVCGRCGYDLSRHPQSSGVCPECGEPFSQFQPDRTWSTDEV